MPSATLRSLLWSLDHQQAVLDQATVVVVDEAAMTTHADLMRLAVGVERAGAKPVLVGDQRQLSALGPRRAIHALLHRHPQLVPPPAPTARPAHPPDRAPPPAPPPRPAPAP